LTRWRAAFAAAAVGVATIVLTALPTSAHAYLVTSNPPDGSVIKLGPQSVWLEFNDQLDASLVKIAIIDSNGRALLPPRSRSTRSARPASTSPCRACPEGSTACRSTCATASTCT
jgi:methionine-rich copper-binding protein CopC